MDVVWFYRCTESLIKWDRFEAFSLFSHGIHIFSYRKSSEHDCSTQTNSEAETLRDHGTSSACRTRLETSQPAQTPGEERQLMKLNSGFYTCVLCSSLRRPFICPTLRVMDPCRRLLRIFLASPWRHSFHLHTINIKIHMGDLADVAYASSTRLQTPPGEFLKQSVLPA